MPVDYDNVALSRRSELLLNSIYHICQKTNTPRFLAIQAIFIYSMKQKKEKNQYYNPLNLVQLMKFVRVK